VRNRLVAVTERASFGAAATSSVGYVYDVHNRRIAKRFDGDADGTVDKSEHYIYDGTDVVLEFVDADGDTSSEYYAELTGRYLWGPGADQLLAQDEISTGGSSETHWALTDQLGSVRDLVSYSPTTNSTSVDYHFVYDSFGQITSGDTTATRYLYTAQEYDAETDQSYYNHRYYDQTTGQFISRDWIVDDTANTYRYVRNNPLTNTDPTGLAPPGVIGPNEGTIADGTYYGNSASGATHGQPTTAVQTVRSFSELEDLKNKDLIGHNTYIRASEMLNAHGSVRVRVFPNGYLEWIEQRQKTEVYRWIPFLGSAKETGYRSRRGEDGLAGLNFVCFWLEAIPLSKPTAKVVGKTVARAFAKTGRLASVARKPSVTAGWKFLDWTGSSVAHVYSTPLPVYGRKTVHHSLGPELWGAADDLALSWGMNDARHNVLLGWNARNAASNADNGIVGALSHLDERLYNGSVRSADPGLPAGVRFQGTVQRAVNPKYADGAWDIHAGNIAANHRYSGSGRGALYTGTSREAVLGELRHYGVDPDSVTWVTKSVQVDNVLDLTNPAVRDQLGITLKQITTNDYLYTQAIGDFARGRYSAILAPSARAPGTSNLVILP
jgi:RHS repeat-associated protein